MKNIFGFSVAILVSCSAFAKEIRTNEVTIPNAPDWLTQVAVEKATDHVQNKLEWSTRRTNVIWHTTEADFQRSQNLGGGVVAVTVNDNGTSVIHMSPRVTASNFNEIFSHELVHVIVYQKYKDAIPKWLEEGLANHIARAQRPNYKWLATQPFPANVTELAHPVHGSTSEIDYRYMASQALAEMLDKKCGLDGLIRLSVQRKMENYIKSYCSIDDLNVAFRNWVKSQAAM